MSDGRPLAAPVGGHPRMSRTGEACGRPADLRRGMRDAGGHPESMGKE